MRLNSRAWPHRFEEVPWRDIAARFDAMAAVHPEFGPVAEIVASVLACGGDAHLAALTSMHDLVVTARPVPAHPPIPVVVVRSPSSGFVGAGGVFIEHRSVTGHDDGIFRDGAEAVPLFWRFMIEKFGIESGFGAQR
ncbi:hypothetical protein Amsp01_058070 [Amycolatopsis sp. NBRC 101858]|uniref:hypothetical protein n=1 Tax=Amycolatopsis sp. NBRC 101858 TaxID=3032200 RepID=UPI0024A45862|nr:hypothetical protein [Amycolatopsis sp. NBRC 101858]GLY39784.1 hypothetical protein Amsp01_058070 [Amycolatopsis sp. NBRC 101858]